MKLFRTVISLLLSVTMPLAAIAKPHEIAQLGSAPLTGEIASTSQLQANVNRQRHLFEVAGTKLGLSPREFAQFAARIDAKQLTYVTIPRHLDAMSWSSGGRVYVLHDVIIPAQTMGWEIDLQERNHVVALFVPARCGNLSILRRPLPAIAKAPAPPRRVAVEAAATAPPVVPPAAPAVSMPAPPPATPAPYESVASSTPPVTHHARWWPLLLIPIVGLIAGGFHGGSTPPLTTVPPLNGPPPGPTPPPAGCTPPPSH